jgi:hypothetical protein
MAVIYDSWRSGAGVPGRIETAVGMLGSSTDADSTVAVITLTARDREGITRLFFHPDADPDPGLLKSTYFVTVRNEALWPVKQASDEIVVDGTPPELALVGAEQCGAGVLDGAGVAGPGEVLFRMEASDTLAGLLEAPSLTLSNGVQTVVLTTETASSPFLYRWTIHAGTPPGRWDLWANATDRAGNVARAVAFLTVAADASLPVVSIRRVGTSDVQLCWPVSCQSYRLEVAPDLQAGPWTTVEAQVERVGNEECVTLEVTGLARWFRVVRR